MNHESAYTKTYLDTVNHYWLNEFKIDGFRFELSKGFTQINNPNDVNAWSAHDASRIAILKRMADKIWEHTPDAYIILEHLGANNEEKELAEYKANDGKGMMLWGKMTDPFNQNTMGFASNSDVSWTYHETRGWNVPHVVGYMESHDEERLMFKNINYGAISGSYSVRTLSTALNRMQSAFALFLSIPGPKMIWQFGELGYDQSINLCTNGTINSNCRLDPKPVKWEYQENSDRNNVYDIISDFSRFRNDYDVFLTDDVTISGNSTLTKSLTLKNSPYTATPSDSSEMNVQLVTNFDLTQKTIEISFPHSGTWYDYYRNTELNVTQTPMRIILPAGEFALFTDVKISKSIITSAAPETSVEFGLAYPNPANSQITIDNKEEFDMTLLNSMGLILKPLKLDNNTWSIENIQPGFYIGQFTNGKQTMIQKISVVK
ncbi:MAG: T9SS type A sorting domain-containing protein [Flammeovirgaceae bacterium]|nr:T9SS type A sorting domain-containing protein [Flammeovirgaceae bacterium]